ncbi:30S ribosomal protein S9 [Candidatus Uhrbacteria bacterium RIFCSPHIGHO2_02_FULL_60_10]|uniref:30S ribosomal protein S9 n=1 Tax=Candidatus Uhrbacteria bacterium RIFCSPHIGHO2_02_FULL_60_10 TaxID=1802392 RepID=A0A1F7U5E2_9BACT|nr:MAG: 30S ribosomal protein S9 [Candidatus Uhrbacteria bacterium RIFCSPHIGHO2_02_FULL_60_10]
MLAIGRRKSAIAQVKLWLDGKNEIVVNDKQHQVYFPVAELQTVLWAPLKAVGLDGQVRIVVETYGGGLRGQAEATRLGISRALLKLNANYRKTLKKLGFLTRDPREKERKKPGLKRARKGSQWAKR